MLEIMSNCNKLLLTGIESKDYALINEALNKGAPIYDKTLFSNNLLFKSWHIIIQLGDIGIIERIYNAYAFKPSHHFQNLLTSVIINKKESFDFFLDKCIQSNVNLNDKFGIILANTCKASPFSTYEEDFKKHFTCDYYLLKLLKENIDLTKTTTHPLVLLADNNNFHSWKTLYQHIKNQKDYSFPTYQKNIVHSLYKFLDKNNFMSEEVQFFLKEFDKKIIFSHGLKKISHPSYKGNDLEVFCLEMFSQEPDLFLKTAHKLGKNNSKFSSTIQKISLFNTLESKLLVQNKKTKGVKI